MPSASSQQTNYRSKSLEKIPSLLLDGLLQSPQPKLSARDFIGKDGNGPESSRESTALKDSHKDPRHTNTIGANSGNSLIPKLSNLIPSFLGGGSRSPSPRPSSDEKGNSMSSPRPSEVIEQFNDNSRGGKRGSNSHEKVISILTNSKSGSFTAKAATVQNRNSNKNELGNASSSDSQQFSSESQNPALLDSEPPTPNNNANEAKKSADTVFDKDANSKDVVPTTITHIFVTNTSGQFVSPNSINDHKPFVDDKRGNVNSQVLGKDLPSFDETVASLGTSFGDEI